MTKTRNRSQSRDPRHRQQLSLPFRQTDPPTQHVGEAQRAAVVALLRQMLIDAVLTKSTTRVSDNGKETDHE